MLGAEEKVLDGVPVTVGHGVAEFAGTAKRSEDFVPSGSVSSQFNHAGCRSRCIGGPARLGPLLRSRDEMTLHIANKRKRLK